MAIDISGSTIAQVFGTEYVIGMFILALIFNSLILWFLTKRFSFKKNGYGYALLVTFITAFISLVFEFTAPMEMEIWMFPLYYVADVILIYMIYPVSLGQSLKVGFMWWILAAFVSLIMGVVIGLILSAIGITVGVQPFIAWFAG
jgi:hypothetical protein